MALAITTTHGQQTPPADQPAASSPPPSTSATPTPSPVRFEGTDLHVNDLPPVSFHGFASQGFLISDQYDYLAKTKEGSFRFSEFGLNASMNPAPRTRIAAQGFSYCVGDTGDYDVVLDYALAEYTFSKEFGIRAGRVRRPEGIYNDIVDLDMARTWVLLPQGMYPARWRDMYSSLDGGDVFGQIPLSKAGSLSYDLYTGLERPQLNGGLADQKANTPPYKTLKDINSPWLAGGQLWWNTPIEGLRLGAALKNDEDVTFHISTGRQTKGTPFAQHYSLDYNWHNWTFQAEYFTYAVDYLNTGGGAPPRSVHIEPDSWYASVAYRFNNWFEAGTYYTEYYPDVKHRSGASYVAANPGSFASDAEQKDIALSLRFDPYPWWIIKVEGHFIQGTGNLYDATDNPVRNNDWWPMLALKTTFTF